MRAVALTAAASLACVATHAALAQSIGIVTTPVGSYSNSAGQAIAKLLNDKAKVRAIVQAQASTGFEEIETAAADFGLSNSFDITFYATGTGDYEGKGKKDSIRYAGALGPYRVGMHVRADSPIQSIADLKGKRLSSDFNAQKTIHRIIEAHLATAGLSYKDVSRVPTPQIVRQAEDFKSGKIDALFFALGSAAVKDAAASVGGLRVLDVSSNPEAIKRAQALLPGAYTIQVSPGPGLDGVTKPTHLVAFDMVLVVSAKTPDETVYRVVKTIHENKADLVATFAPMAGFEPSKMGRPNEGVTTHPGAMKYFREAGLVK